MSGFGKSGTASTGGLCGCACVGVSEENCLLTNRNIETTEKSNKTTINAEFVSKSAGLTDVSVDLVTSRTVVHPLGLSSRNLAIALWNSSLGRGQSRWRPKTTAGHRNRSGGTEVWLAAFAIRTLLQTPDNNQCRYSSNAACENCLRENAREFGNKLKPKVTLVKQNPEEILRSLTIVNSYWFSQKIFTIF